MFEKNKETLKNDKFKKKEEYLVLTKFIESGYSWLLNETLLNYKYFCIKRCPYDRFVSGFLYSSNKNNIYTLKDCILSKEKFKNGKVENTVDDLSAYTHIFFTQCHFIQNIPNLTILCFDNLNNELCNFLLENGIKEILHENKPINASTTKSKKFWEYYDNFSLNFVNTYFDEDFKFFGYPKYTNISDFYYHMIIKHTPHKEF